MLNKYVSFFLIFLYRFIEGKPNLKSITTLGFDGFTSTVQLSDGSLINCQIFDTAGQERYNSINFNYYRMAHAVLLVYDISRKSSFEKIKTHYIKQIKNICKEDVIVLLIANKADLEKKKASNNRRRN